MTTKKITFDIESREDEEDRTTISINGIGEVVLIETFPEYEFLEDIGEDGLEELNVEEGDLIGKIEHLEIEDEYKGQGYAKILMNKAIELAKEKGLIPLYLNASPMGSKRYGLDVDDLTEFYESLGFEVFLRQGGNNLMILKDTYKTGGETKNKIMAKQIKIQFEDNYAKGGVTYSEWSKNNVFQEQFNDWKKDGNVSKNADGTYSTQDSQYANRLKGISGLKKYFYNEFIKGQYAEGGSVGKGYNVFNYTDNIYATDEVFKTKKLANDFIKEFRNRFSKQGYYRDNQMNKIAIEDIDLLAITSDFNPFGKYEDGGEVKVDGLTKQDFIDAYLKRVDSVIENLKQKGQYDSEDFDLLGEVDKEGGFTEIEDVGYWLHWAEINGNYDALIEFISVYDFSNLSHYTLTTLAHLFFGKPMKLDFYIIQGGDLDYAFNTELQKIKLLLNKIDFDKITGEIDYEEIENNTNLKFYKDGTLVMSLNGDWNEETEELDTTIDIDGETTELNYHPLDSMGGVNMQQLEKNINEALRELNTYSAVVSIEGYEEYAEDVEGLENAKALIQDIKGNTRFQVLKGSSVGIGKRVDDSRVIEEFARGGEAGFDDTNTSMLIYHEKKGNFMIPKNQIYLWLYEGEGVNEKLASGEYDYVFYPYASISMMGQSGFIPPLKKIWTKKFQKQMKGSEYLLGVIKAFLIEEDDKKELYIDMMSVNPTKKKKGIMSYMIKDLRDSFNLSQDQVTFSNLTDEGKKFVVKKTYVDGGRVKTKEYFQIFKLENLLDKTELLMTEEELNKFISKWNLDNLTDYADWVEFNEYEDYKRITPVFSKNEYGGNVNNSFVESEINSVSTWENEEIATYLEVPVNEVAKHRDYYVEETQNAMLVNQVDGSYAKGGELKVGSKVGFLRPRTGRYEYAEVLSIDGDNVNLVVRHPKRSQWDNYFTETIERITRFSNTLSEDYDRPVMKVKYADGGSVEKYDNGGVMPKPISFTEEKKGLYYVEFSDGENILVDFTLPELADQRTKKYIFQQAIHNYERDKDKYAGGGYVGSMVRQKNLRGGYNNYVIIGYNEIYKKYTLKDLEKDFTISATDKELKNDFEFTDNYAKGGKTISQTPAPKKDQIKGSSVNKEGSSKDLKSASKLKFSDDVIETLKTKVEEHNAKYPKKKITLDSAKAVLSRGMGAFSTSYRPTIGGGKKNSRVAWGLARLNAFIYKIINGTSKSGKYSQDNDLIEELGYKVQKFADGGNLLSRIPKTYELELDYKVGQSFKEYIVGGTADCYITSIDFQVNEINGLPVVHPDSYRIEYKNTTYVNTNQVHFSFIKNLKKEKNKIKIEVPYSIGGGIFFENNQYEAESDGTKLLNGIVEAFKVLYYGTRNDWFNYYTNINGKNYSVDSKDAYSSINNYISRVSKDGFIEKKLEKFKEPIGGKLKVKLDYEIGQKIKVPVMGGFEESEITGITIKVNAEDGKIVKNSYNSTISYKNVWGGREDTTEIYADFEKEEYANKIENEIIIDIKALYLEQYITLHRYMGGAKLKVDNVRGYKLIIDKNGVKTGYIDNDIDFEIFTSINDFKEKISSNDLTDKGKKFVVKKTYADGGIIEVVGKGNKGAFRKREYEGMTEKEVADFWLERGYTLSKSRSESKLKPYTFYIQKYDDGGDVPNQDKMFQLPLEMVIYVPSTQDVDKVISVDKMDERVDEVKIYLANKFGGYTSADKLGGFVDSTGNLVNEDVVQVTSFSTKEAYEEHKEELIQQLSDWGKKWGQESIGFEFEGDLMYVPQELNNESDIATFKRG